MYLVEDVAPTKFNKNYMEKNTKEELELMSFFLKEAGKLAEKRKKAGFDHKHENGTYTEGYYDALMDISRVMILKTNLE